MIRGYNEGHPNIAAGEEQMLWKPAPRHVIDCERLWVLTDFTNHRIEGTRVKQEACTLRTPDAAPHVCYSGSTFDTLMDKQ